MPMQPRPSSETSSDPSLRVFILLQSLAIAVIAHDRTRDYSACLHLLPAGAAQHDHPQLAPQPLLGELVGQEPPVLLVAHAGRLGGAREHLLALHHLELALGALERLGPEL